MDNNDLAAMTVNIPDGERKVFYRAGTSDEQVLLQIFEKQEYALQRLKRGNEILQFISAQHNSGRRPIIIDAGANIGASAVFFAVAFPTAIIIAIEPEERNFAILCKNVEGLNVKCLRAGLSSTEGSLRVFDPGEGHWGYRTEPITEGTGTIPCVTVSQIYQQECQEGVFPFIVKIDIEGAESNLFDKDTAWFAKTPIVIIELHDWLMPKVGTSRSFLQCVAGQPRDFILVGENIYSIAYSLN